MIGLGQQHTGFHEYFYYEEYDDEDDFGRSTCDHRKGVVDAGPVDDGQEDKDRLVQRFADILNDVLH